MKGWDYVVGQAYGGSDHDVGQVYVAVGLWCRSGFQPIEWRPYFTKLVTTWDRSGLSRAKLSLEFSNSPAEKTFPSFTSNIQAHLSRPTYSSANDSPVSRNHSAELAPTVFYRLFLYYRLNTLLGLWIGHLLAWVTKFHPLRLSIHKGKLLMYTILIYMYNIIWQ